MTPERTSTQPAQTASPNRLDAAAGRRIASVDLLGERGELIIVHAGREYRLRLTHSGKLILTA